LAVWISFFGHEPTEESLEYAWQMLKEAEKRLKKTIEKAEKSDTKDIQKWKDK
jgi:hypothetical protein